MVTSHLEEMWNVSVCFGGLSGGHTSSLNLSHTSPSVPEGLFSRGLGLGTKWLGQAGLPTSQEAHAVARLPPALCGGGRGDRPQLWEPRGPC